MRANEASAVQSLRSISTTKVPYSFSYGIKFSPGLLSLAGNIADADQSHAELTSMSHQEFRILQAQNRMMMVCGSAGVSPAIFMISTQRKNAGGTPALRKPTFLREFDKLHFADRIRREKSGSIDFMLGAGVKSGYQFAFAPIRWTETDIKLMNAGELSRHLIALLSCLEIVSS
jgi:hypothetical protein